MFRLIRKTDKAIQKRPPNKRLQALQTTLGERYEQYKTETAGHNTDRWDGDSYMNNYYIKNSGEKHLRDFTTPLYLNNIWESLGVPVFHITFNDYNQELKSDFQDFEILNIRESTYSQEEYLYYKARDLSHNGREFHDKVKEIILNKIKNG